MKLAEAVLETVLIKNKLVNNKQLKELRDSSQKAGISLYSQVISSGLVVREVLCGLIAKYFDVKCFDPNTMTVDKEALKLMSEIVAKKNLAAVFVRDEHGVHLVVNNPANEEFIKNFEKRIDEDVILYFADEEAILKIISQYRGEVTENSLGDLIASISQSDTAAGRAEDLPVIQIVDTLLSMSYENKASDIHIEPFEAKTVIRFRIDGILHDIVDIPTVLHDLIVTRIKILSRLRTDEHRSAQDGRLSFKYKKAKIDVRVSIVPLIKGEKVVMRLLAEGARKYKLTNLGFNKNDFKKVKNAINKPWGMILVTGPTGSGKTTTLYSILNVLNTREINISTIEDPVEYDIDGINQIQVNPKTNLTFSDGLRAIVRQDPDIIMVGEIRDPETASIAINSAMTGHLVLSTLHTNDAPTSLPRLLDMGIKSFLVASTVNVIIAQRLVRQICEKCKYTVSVAPEVKEIIEKQLSPTLIKKYGLNLPKTILYYGKGCKACQNSGYSGRIGIFEVLMMNEDVKQLVLSKVNASTLKAKAMEAGMLPMIEDGLLKVQQGITTIDEVLRVTRE